MRIAIVTETAAVADSLRRMIFSMSPDRVAWTASNGAEAVEQSRRDTPDLILMDLMMPIMDGAQATRKIMAQTPCPILIVTTTLDGLAGKVVEALGAGALDAVQAPALSGNCQKLGMAALRFKIEQVRRLTGEGNTAFATDRPDADQNRTACDRLVAIGASAGGPAALAIILHDLPADFPAPVVIVQHVDPQFVPLMADWLSDQSAMPVRVAGHGDYPRAGEALIAGTGNHLVFADAQSLCYTPNPMDCHQRPSVDVFFESVLQYWRGDVAAVLLTGMGRDGARGLKALRDAGFLTIAQDSGTCAVYGMPKAAVELGAAVKVLPVEKISQQLIDFAGFRSRGRLA